jgi:hypothetical protein
VSFRRHLVRWESEYGACGLHVIEVSGGDAAFAPSRARLARWVATHPVLWDRDSANARNYAVREWPSAFLLGPDGTVVWQGNPATITRDRNTELEFRELLAEQLRRAELVRK